ncbi:MAG: P-loop NTPase [Deltaproteobacteria bacterium]|nr:P-loop NTPase [Deltaproteobacteria bacterium]MBW2361812.1 P-loop NTPase [Deltaproteobacteria bacterium]
MSAELRKSAARFRPATSEPRLAARPPRMIPVGGGKGGVGKTFVVANLAVSLARMGHRVVAVDADLEGPNLHTCLGLAKPPVSLADYVAHREEDLGKLLLDSSVPGLHVIAGTRSNLATPQPGHARRVQLIRELRRLPADFVLLDLGAGMHPAVVDYFMVSDDGLLVIAPEPTSVENAYAFLRAAFYRRLRLAMASHDVRSLVTLAMDEQNERGIRTPLELLREIEALDPSEGAHFVETMRAFRPRIVINEVRTAEDVKLGFSVKSVCRKYFGIEAEYLGYVSHDADARKAVRGRRPLVDLSPRSDASNYLRRVARKLADLPSARG